MNWTFLSALASLLLSSSHVAAQSKLDTLTENREGIVEDIAGPRTFESPDQARIWLAEGRIRAALRLGDRFRVHSEDHLFSSADPSTPAFEKLIALEFNNANGNLYTLTEAGLYREKTIGGTQSQSNPGSEVFLNFSATSTGEQLDSTESFQDLKIWPGTNRIFLLTSVGVKIVVA